MWMISDLKSLYKTIEGVRSATLKQVQQLTNFLIIGYLSLYTGTQKYGWRYSEMFSVSKSETLLKGNSPKDYISFIIANLYIGISLMRSRTVKIWPSK